MSLVKTGAKLALSKIPIQYKIAIGAGAACIALLVVLILGFATVVTGGYYVKSSEAEELPPPSISVPVDGVIYPFNATFQVTSDYGYRWGELHAGMDFVAYEGAPVLAVDSGVVVDSRVSSSYGETITIMHDNGYYTRYAHMETGSRTVQVGDVVVKGQTIGTMGSTGDSTGPHLHFELRTANDYNDANAIDPRFMYPDLPPPYTPVTPPLPPSTIPPEETGGD